MVLFIVSSLRHGDAAGDATPGAGVAPPGRHAVAALASAGEPDPDAADHRDGADRVDSGAERLGLQGADSG